MNRNEKNGTLFPVLSYLVAITLVGVSVEKGADLTLPSAKLKVFGDTLKMSCWLTMTSMYKF